VGADRAALQRRTLRVLIGAQILGGAGFFLGFAVSVLLARELIDGEALVGLPVAIAVAAAALAARPLGAWMQRSGRRPGLALGQACGAAGALVILLSARVESFTLFCAGMGLFGVGNASNLLARYAASDLSEPARRGHAISALLFATAAGAMLGPNLAEAAGGLGDELGVSAKAAPFAISFLLLSGAAAVTLALLRPDPLLVARELAAQPAAPAAAAVPPPPASEAEFVAELEPETPAAGPTRAPRLGVRAWPRAALIGAAALVFANVTMVSIMTVTPLHLDDAGQSLGVVGLVISLHVAGMFLPSPLSGALVDRVGRVPVIAAAGVVLLLAGGVAAPTSGHSVAPVIAALVLLGIGWNLGLVGGSTLLTDAIPLAERARAQGQADFAMGMAGALGSLAAGPVLHAGGYALLGIAGAGLGAGLVLLALRGGLLSPAPAGAR
jgi:MFS family permease